jgi:hypothetical protein
MAVKPVVSKPNNEDPNDFELVLEKRASDDSYFLLKNSGFETQHEKKPFVNTDSFFGLFHWKTSQKRKKILIIKIFY